ncbi:MAG: cation transporter, partial [Fimbriimonadaceae bacterium]|nr:cation transporter [Chitinophagales bacterium]
MEEKYNGLKLAERGARISIIAYIALSLLKLGVGYISGSKALTADGFNNTTDIVASLAVLIGLKISRKPADDDHTYGHFRAETIASLIASLIMIAVGINVLYNAARDIISVNSQPPDLTAAVVGVICAIAIYFVYRYNKKIAIQINSSGLMAAAKDNLSDAWVSIGTTVGIVASQFGFPWIDPLAAVIVGLLIIKTGWDIFREATLNLTDGFKREELDNITESINNV